MHPKISSSTSYKSSLLTYGALCQELFLVTLHSWFTSHLWKWGKCLREHIPRWHILNNKKKTTTWIPSKYSSALGCTQFRFDLKRREEEEGVNDFASRRMTLKDCKCQISGNQKFSVKLRLCVCFLVIASVSGELVSGDVGRTSHTTNHMWICNNTGKMQRSMGAGDEHEKIM